MKQYFSIAISSLLLSSCIFDPPSPHIWIENESDKNVELIVKFNKDFLFNRFGVYTCTTCFNNYTGYYSDNCVQLLKFDTINFVGSYILPKDCRFNLDLDFHQAPKPRLEFDSLLIIREKDTLKLSGKPEMLNQFKKEKWHQYHLKIK